MRISTVAAELLNAFSIVNANALLDLATEQGSFSAWLWSFVGGKPARGHFRGALTEP